MAAAEIKIAEGSAVSRVARSLLANTGWVTFGALVWAALSAAYSVHRSDWGWFQRSGSILTVAGLLLAGRSLVRAGRAGLESKSTFSIAAITATSYDQNGQLMANLQHSPETIQQRREERRDETAGLVGFVLALLGTIVWGYGDLIGCIGR